ncbi:unnamed protein product [Cylicostephanus goldi]|uniref:7TM GPCR serpentine receptor class x (Srx) domain-containing protein n=1 Tax=Cylicostephanus goldi TaxID=71465 RepID=A0A3P6QPT6_CYLGO|nr:unnamed protein product [Cylicostephanus goldi]
MVLERAIALWKRNQYEELGSALGFAIAGSCITAGAALATWSLIKTDLSTELVHCSATNSATAYRLQIRSYVLCGINLVALFFSGLVFFFNAAAIKRRYVNLRSSYQLQENINVITVIIPLSVFQSICHLLLSIGDYTILHVDIAANFATVIEIVVEEASDQTYHYYENPKRERNIYRIFENVGGCRS